MKIILIIIILSTFLKNNDLDKSVVNNVEILDSVKTIKYIVYFCKNEKNNIITLIVKRDSTEIIYSDIKIQIGEKYKLILDKSELLVKDLFFKHTHLIIPGTNVSLTEFDRLKRKLNINYPQKYTVRGLENSIRDYIDSIYSLEMKSKNDSVKILKKEKKENDLKYFYRFFFMESHYFTSKNIKGEYYTDN